MSKNTEPHEQPPWRDDVEMLISEGAIRDRVAAMGAEITANYSGAELVIVGVLKGSFVFYADLVRTIDLPLQCEFIGISSYGNQSESTGVVQITSDLSRPIQGADVLIVEDIIDTGLSMRYLLDNLSTRHPRSLSVCTLLAKPNNVDVKVPIDYTGFQIPNAFVVGYGLDYAGLYRNLPCIGIYNGRT